MLDLLLLCAELDRYFQIRNASLANRNVLNSIGEHQQMYPRVLNRRFVLQTVDQWPYWPIFAGDKKLCCTYEIYWDIILEIIQSYVWEACWVSWRTFHSKPGRGRGGWGGETDVDSTVIESLIYGIALFLCFCFSWILNSSAALLWTSLRIKGMGKDSYVVQNNVTLCLSYEYRTETNSTGNDTRTCKFLWFVDSTDMFHAPRVTSPLLCAQFLALRARKRGAN